MWLLKYFCLVLLFYRASAQPAGGLCKTPLGTSGVCMSIFECRPIIALLKAPSRTNEQTEFIISSKCGFSPDGFPYVCCGSESEQSNNHDNTFIPNRSIPSRNECGWQSQNRIFNGEKTTLDEFPWMALIEYLYSTGHKKVSCAGSLINSRYVLTAAHCVVKDNPRKGGQPINIRLGEYDLSSPGQDCFVDAGFRICNEPEVNVGIEEIIPHPDYGGKTNRENDIALIRLKKDISYSDFIQPICLPEPNEKSRNGDRLTVAGWGRTENGRNSNLKLKLSVPVSDFSNCSRIFSREGINLIEIHQICAGGEEGKDSCTGDSGGPLMRTLLTGDSRWMIEGIVSFGATQCGTKGLPGIYARVAPYVAWIHKTVRA